MSIARTLNAGELRNVIVIQSLPAVIAQDSRGGENRGEDQWSTVVTAHAKIDTQGGREFMAARAVNAELTHEISIRWMPGLGPGMRVLFTDPSTGNNRYFDIRAVVNPNNEIPYSLLLHVRELVDRVSVT